MNNELPIHPLRLWRVKKGMSQRDFAREAKLSQQYISHIENGIRVPKYETAKVLSKATRGRVSVIKIMEFKK